MTDATTVATRPAMPQFGRREALVGGALLAAAGTAYALIPRREENYLGSAKLEALVPNAFAGWAFDTRTALILPPADQLRDQIYNQILARSYRHADGNEVMLLIAYNGLQDGTLQIHRPEVCYPAGGFKLTRIEDRITLVTDTIKIPSRYIIAETGLRYEQIIYWTRLGKFFPREWAEQKWAVMQENLQGFIPDGVLVRISLLTQGDARSTLDRFAGDLYRSVGPRMRSVLVGKV